MPVDLEDVLLHFAEPFHGIFGKFMSGLKPFLYIISGQRLLQMNPLYIGNHISMGIQHLLNICYPLFLGLQIQSGM